MNGFIMAAGLGTRLEPFTFELPKPLFPAGGGTFLDRSTGLMKDAGIDRVVINCHHLGDRVKTCVEENERFGLDVIFSDEEEILGTGGGARPAAAMLEPAPLLITACDVVSDLDMNALLQSHRSSGAAATMVLAEQGDSTRYGGIMVDGEGFIIDIANLLGRSGKREAGLVNASAYIIEPGAARHLPGPGGCLIRDFFIPLLRDGTPVNTFIHRGFWMEGGTPAAFLDLNMSLLDLEFGGGGEENGTIAPCSIDRDAVLGERAVAGPHAVIAAGCRLGEESTVRRSVLLPGATVAPGQVVEDTLLSQSHKWNRFSRERVR